MGLSLAEAERCGIAHLHPDHPANKREAEPVAKAKGPRITGKNEYGQNKTEAAWDRRLADLRAAGVIRAYAFELFKIRLAGNTYYSPDFVVMRNDGSLAILEIKGFMRDDAAVKLKVAAEQCAWLGQVYLVRRDGKGWDIRRVSRTGVGRYPLPGDEWAQGGEVSDA